MVLILCALIGASTTGPGDVFDLEDSPVENLKVMGRTEDYDPEDIVLLENSAQLDETASPKVCKCRM